MNHEESCPDAARATVRAALLVVLTFAGGCAAGARRSASDASALSYFPHHSATQATAATAYQAEPCFFGHHETCWRAWPEEWRSCPTPDSSVEEGSESLLLPQATVPQPDATPSLPTEAGAKPAPAPDSLPAPRADARPSPPDSP